MVYGVVDSMAHHFAIDEEIGIADVDGTSIRLKFAFISGFTSFVRYRWIE